MITFSHVTKHYDGRGKQAEPVVALDDVSLEVAQGQIFGILGRSGAGKTTLFRCLNQLEPVTAGTITVDGVDWTSLWGAKLRAERRRMGTIFQHFNLLASRTVADNVGFGLELAGENKQAIGPRVTELLELVGLPDKAKAYPSQLSGGQKQRVGIARALATRPKVLLMDEATSALDPTTTEQILDLVKDLRDRMGLTVLLITHESDVVRRICDGAALMEGGRVVEQGNLLDLVADPDSRIADQLIPLGRDDESFGVHSQLLSFVNSGVNEPLISSFTRQTGIDVSILGGSVEQIAGHKVGRLRVAFDHPHGEVDDALIHQFFSERGVTVSR
ncbi:MULTISPECIES: methionine ABC transporter ATP-binding protein [unclassified Luteococcus]|uniref:methionine ABC transporter ATP-binding protein n=1 Tax=unclassified Luteococcus TaxID=2639923 RepID=UPI00313D6CE8